MSVTRDLAHYLADLDFNQLPDTVRERATLAVLDTLGVAVGGLGVPDYSDRLLALAKATGGGVSEATVIGDGTRLSLPFAAFANAALATALDFSDSAATRSGLAFASPGALSVPAALAAAEATGGTGSDFLAGVVAGYECVGRILRSMDMSTEQSQYFKGETVSVFAAAAAAGRAARLSHDAMLSALGMTGVCTPVSSGFKWLMDTGLRPRKDIKQGWAWMALTGVFAAQAARIGWRATQENNILDGDRGLWRMLGMDSYDPTEITRGLGVDYVLPGLQTKRVPGCGITHTGLRGAQALVRDHAIDVASIERIEVTTNHRSGIEEDDQAPATVQDMQFSIPYQIGAALSGEPRGPFWYTAAAQFAGTIAAKTFVMFDEECDAFWRENHRQMSKVSIATTSGERYDTRMESDPRPVTPEEFTEKFYEVSSQVIGGDAAIELRNAVIALPASATVGELVAALVAPTAAAAA